VHYLRNIQDADALIGAITSLKATGGEAVCIGGGYIGMEVAAALSINGLKVTMVFPEGRLMERLLTPKLAAFYEDFYKAKGITLVKEDLVVELEQDAQGAVSCAVLKSGGRLPASLVVVGVGARPNSELLDGQVELIQGPPGGIAVNARLCASASDVFAAGDVAAFPLAAAGGKVQRQEHVAHCRQSATFVMAEMMDPGVQPDYDYLPFFYSRIFSLSWQFYGLAEGDAVHFGDFAAGKFGAYWVRDGSVVGAFLEGGSAEENAAIKKAATERPAAPADLSMQGVAFASKL
jgi:monodehydroascorbate reductase (NADH)